MICYQLTFLEDHHHRRVQLTNPTKKDTTTNFRECVVHGWLRSVYGVRNLSAKVVDTVIVWKLFSSQLVCKIHYYCSAVSQSVTSITLFFSRIRDRMVRGETWSHWVFSGCLEHFQTKTGSSPFWRMELVHYSWVSFFAGAKKSSHFFSSFGTATEE